MLMLGELSLDFVDPNLSCLGVLIESSSVFSFWWIENRV